MLGENKGLWSTEVKGHLWLTADTVTGRHELKVNNGVMVVNGQTLTTVND